MLDEGSLKTAIVKWLDSFGCHNEGETTKEIAQAVIDELGNAKLAGKAAEEVAYLLAHKEHIAKKTVWCIGGDGWAYDIGYGGLDHVLATTETSTFSLSITKYMPIQAVSPRRLRRKVLSHSSLLLAVGQTRKTLVAS